MTVAQCRDIRVFDDPNAALSRLRDERAAFVSGFSDGDAGWPPRPGDRAQSQVHGDAYALGYAAGREFAGLEPWAPELARAWEDGVRAGVSAAFARVFGGTPIRAPAVARGSLGEEYVRGFWAGVASDKGD